MQPKPVDSRARLATFGMAKPLSAGAHGGACVKGVAMLSYRGVGYQILEMRWSSLQPWPCCSLRAGCLRLFLCFHQGTAPVEQVAEAEDVFMGLAPCRCKHLAEHLCAHLALCRRFLVLRKLLFSYLFVKINF